VKFRTARELDSRLRGNDEIMDIDELGHGLMGLIEAAKTLEELEGARVAILGKNGEFTGLLKTLGSMSPAERGEKGRGRHLPFAPFCLFRQTL
jgi:hypothetical protein